MSATSRRSFLSGAAATTATLVAGCQECPPSELVSTTTAASVPSEPAADVKVAASFFRYQRFLDPALTGKPSAVLLMYGLVCVDFGPDKELLLPRTNGIGSGVHSHRARVWVPASLLDATSDPADGTEPETTSSFPFWDISGKIVTIEALDAGGTALTSPSPDLAWRNDPNHPWNDSKWVRCLKDLTGKSMIPAASRNNPAIMTSRVTLTKGTVIAIPPFSERGRNTRWKVTRTDGSGSDMVTATTDAMVFHQESPAAMAKFRISLKPMVGAGPTKNIIVNKNPKNQLIAVVTHAMTGTLASPNLLTDTKAFGQLLATGTVGAHPAAVALQNQPEAGMMLSGSDGHCECACD